MNGEEKMEIEPRHKFYNSFVKRFFDILLSALALLMFSWLYAIVAILVKINLGSPVIFVHERPGRILQLEKNVYSACINSVL